MMKVLGTVVGLAALLVTGTANATIVYDTIIGQTENSAGSRDSLSPKVANSRGPLGDAITASSDEWLSSVTLRLRNINTTTDTGAILVYLVPSTGTGTSNLPSASGLALSPSRILLGQVNDTQVAFGGTGVPNPSSFANVTIAANAFLAGGTTYWIEVADAKDPVNGNGNTVASFLKWGINSDVTGLGVPGGPNNIFSVSNAGDTGLTAFNSTNDTFVTPTGGEVFELQVQTPEPASLALLGAGVIGLGVIRRRNKKLAD